MTASHAIDPEQDRIDQEASSWVVLASEQALTAGQQREFDAWRAADPRHEKAWRDFSRTWGDLPAMRSLGDLVPLREPTANGEDRRPSRRRAPPRAAWGAIAAALIVAMAIPAYLGRSRPEHYATRIAQTRLIALPDGTQVTLGPRSTLEVRFSQGERRVALTGGEAFFEVVRDEDRPFLVEAGASEVRVLGTKFDVNYSAQSVRVSVLQGLVEVKDGGRGAESPPTTRLLRSGQRAEIVLALPHPAQPMPAPAPLPAQAPGAWREGRLVYENARLADLVADVNRYYAPGVTIRDPAVGELRVTAAFRASEIPAFLGSVGGVVPVRAEEGPDGAFRFEALAESR